MHCGDCEALSVPEDPTRTVRIRDARHLFRREFDVRRLNEFLQGFELGRPYDRGGDGLVRQGPGEGDLRETVRLRGGEGASEERTWAIE